MSFSWINIGLLAGAYLMGSVPTSVWAGKWIAGIDIREHGSKNAGATNTIRVLGVKIGLPVLLFDIFKGWLATTLVYLFDPGYSNPEVLIQGKLILGGIALAGHLFPVFANFKGGKGIATLLGMFFGVHPFTALVSLGIFVIVFVFSRIVSLSSLSAVLAFPVIARYLFDVQHVFFLYFSIFIVIVEIITHRENVKRLIKGEERKLTFKKDKSK